MAKDFARSFYNSKRWVSTRNAFFKYRHGRCERCNKPGAIVHHKIRLTPNNISNPMIAVSFDNLELLCRVCHEKEHRPRENHAEDVMFVNGKLVKRENSNIK
jgi:5-methylcytosine-specific restriction endonuclease McrA